MAQRRSSTTIRLFFFFNDTATTEIYTLSLHDALPISSRNRTAGQRHGHGARCAGHLPRGPHRCTQEHWRERAPGKRSEEHTSELQSQSNLVCRLLLEKKKGIHRRVQSVLIGIDKSALP